MKNNRKILNALLFSLLLPACTPIHISKGYKSESDYHFAKEIGNLTPRQVDILRSYGIENKSQMNLLILDVLRNGYAKNKATWNDILLFISDKKEAERKGISIAEQKQSRELKEEQDRKKRERSEAEERKKIEKIHAQERKKREQLDRKRQQEYAKKFTYTAVFSCNLSGRHMDSMLPCLSGSHSSYSQIELRNGSQYGLYQPWELDKIGKSIPSVGFVIPLQSNFLIKTRNLSEHLVLNLKIIHNQSQRVVWEKSVAQYGTIYVNQ